MQQRAVDDALGAEHDRDVALAGRRRDRRTTRARGTRGSGGGTLLAHAAIARHEALRKADDVGARGARAGDRVLGRRDRLVGSRREREVGECYSQPGHALAFMDDLKLTSGG